MPAAVAWPPNSCVAILLFACGGRHEPERIETRLRAGAPAASAKGTAAQAFNPRIFTLDVRGTRGKFSRYPARRLLLWRAGLGLIPNRCGVILGLRTNVGPNRLQWSRFQSQEFRETDAGGSRRSVRRQPVARRI